MIGYIFKALLFLTKILCANTFVEIQAVDLDTSLPTGVEIVCLLNSSESEHHPERAGLSTV